MARGIYGYTVKDLTGGSKRVKETPYDYKSIGADSESKRFYSFTIKEHYDEQARKMRVRGTNDFLKTSIKAQREREMSLLNELGYTGSFESMTTAFAKDVLSADSNTIDVLDTLDFNELFSMEGYQPRRALKEESFKNILGTIKSELQGLIDMKDEKANAEIKGAIKNGKINSSAIKKAMRDVAKLSRNYDVAPKYKTTLTKELNKILKPLKGDIGEFALQKQMDAVMKELQSRGQLTIDMSKNGAKVTGKKLTGTGKQVKADVVAGNINLQSKNYTIKNSFKSTPISLHSGSINSLGEYMRNYKRFTEDDVNNFIFNFVNIYNFSSSGGVNSDRDGTVNYSENSFAEYENILSCVREAAAIWMGTTLGLSEKGQKVFSGESLELTNVDFLVVGNNAIVPISELLIYIQQNVDSIEVHFDKKLVANPLEVYEDKLNSVKGESNWSKTNTGETTNYFSYPEPIRRVGSQYGKMAAFTTASIKFMFILNKFKQYSNL